MALSPEERKPLRQFIIVVVAIAIFIALINLGKIADKNETNTDENTNTELPAEEKWKEVALGSSELTIKSPLELREFSFEVPQTWKDQFSDYKFYKVAGETFIGQLIYCNFKEADPNLDIYLSAMAKGGVDNLRNVEGISNLISSTRDITISNLKGKEITGTFDEGGKNKEFKSVVFVSSKIIWNFVFTFNPNDQNAQRIINTIINSSKLHKST